MLAHLGVPRAARCDRRASPAHAVAAARRAGDGRGDPARDRGAARARGRRCRTRETRPWTRRCRRERLARRAVRGVGRATARAVLVSVVADARLGAARVAGTRWSSRATRVDGTIGGGHLEFEAIAHRARRSSARDATRNGCVRFPLGAQPRPVLRRRRDARCSSRSSARRGVARRRRGAARATASPCVIVAADARRRRHGTAGRDRGGRASATLRRRMRRRSRAPRGRAARPRRRHAACRRPTALAPALLVDPVEPIDFAVAAVRQRHVGRALVQVLGALPCARALDRRARGRLSRRRRRPTSTSSAPTCPRPRSRRARPARYVLVMTHSHALDFALDRADPARATTGATSA